MPVTVNKAENGDPPGDQNFEEIDLAEEELIDAYVRGELAADERQLLEKGLRSSPQLIDRLHFARLLADAADRDEAEVSVAQAQRAPSGKSWWPFGRTWLSQPAFNLAFAASALVIFIGIAGLLAGWINLRRQTQQLTDQRLALESQKSELQKAIAEQKQTSEQLTAELKERLQKLEADQQRLDELIQAQSQKSGPSFGTIATLLLTRSLRSSDPPPERKLSPGTSEVKLQLAVSSIDYRSFQVEIKNSQGTVIPQPKIPAPRSGKLVNVTIASKLLPPGEYSVQLTGISAEGVSEPVGNYRFRINQ